MRLALAEYITSICYICYIVYYYVCMEMTKTFPTVKYAY